MYNENQKMAFVDSKERSITTKNFLIQIFKWFEPYENQWGMDLSLQSAEILQPVVNELSGLRSKSTELFIIMLKEYVKWLKNNGYEYTSGIYDVKIDSIEKIRNQMVSSPKHLAEIMERKDTGWRKENGDIIFRGFYEAEEETVDVTYRVFLWMAYAGLCDDEALQVKSSDVDLSKMVINFNGKKYEIYREAKEDFEKACRLMDFNYIHKNYTTRRDRAAGDLITRGLSSSEIDIKTMRPIINRKLNPQNPKEKVKLKEKRSYNKIYLSGIFHRAFEKERMGLPVDFSEYVSRDMQSIKDFKPTATRTYNSVANKLEREYIADYEKWKCAYEYNL